MKSNQVKNILNFYLGYPPQSLSSLLVEMRGRLGSFILNMACGLSIPSPGWGRSPDQGRSANTDVAPESREISVCKSKDGKQDEQIDRQGIQHGRSDPHIDILLLCA